MRLRPRSALKRLPTRPRGKPARRPLRRPKPSMRRLRSFKRRLSASTRSSLSAQVMRSLPPILVPVLRRPVHPATAGVHHQPLVPPVAKSPPATLVPLLPLPPLAISLLATSPLRSPPATNPLRSPLATNPLRSPPVPTL